MRARGRIAFVTTLSTVGLVLVSLLGPDIAMAWQTYYQDCGVITCRDDAVNMGTNPGSTSSGSSVINLGPTASGGVVAIALTGAATGGVINVSTLLGSPTSTRSASHTDATSPVPGCTTASNMPPGDAAFGTLPITPWQEKPKGGVTARIDWMIGAGCNQTGGPFSGTYANAFIVRCKARVDDARPGDTVTLIADWYDTSQPSSAGPNGYRPGDGFTHTRKTDPLELDAGGNVVANLALADYRQSNAHGAVIGCAAQLTRDGVTTPHANIPQAWMQLFVPIPVWYAPTLP